PHRRAWRSGDDDARTHLQRSALGCMGHSGQFWTVQRRGQVSDSLRKNIFSETFVIIFARQRIFGTDYAIADYVAWLRSFVGPEKGSTSHAFFTAPMSVSVMLLWYARVTARAVPARPNRR